MSDHPFQRTNCGQNPFDARDSVGSNASFGYNSMDFHEQLRRQTILNSMENKDYLLVIATQQNKSVQQVKHELRLKLVYG